MTYHAQFLLLVVAGWVNRQQQDVIDYLQEENRVLRLFPRWDSLPLNMPAFAGRTRVQKHKRTQDPCVALARSQT